MSASIVIPFNHMPASTTVRTASYTIPAGFYARVVANVEGTGTFTIGGSTALRGTSNQVLASSVLDFKTSLGFQRLCVESSTAGSPDGNAFTSTTNATSTTESYWLPTGAVINGTGTWRAVVELYPVIA